MVRTCCTAEHQCRTNHLLVKSAIMFSKDSLVSAVLVVCAIIVAGATLRRELGPPSQIRTIPASAGKPEYVPGWEQFAVAGMSDRSDDAPITLIEFSDLECPFCRQFHQSLTKARSGYADKIRHVFIHFPIEGHRFARPAARAAECAARQGRFFEFVHQIFELQDSLGFKTLASYGTDAGVPDSLEFKSCLAETGRVDRIEAGLKLGKEIGVPGTPTVIVNGWRFASTPSDDQLAKAINDLLEGRKPFD